METRILRTYPVRNELGEGARFDPRTGELYWVDILAGRFWSLSFGASAPLSWEAPDKSSAVFLTQIPGRVLVSADHSIWSFDLRSGVWRERCSLKPLKIENRFNDGNVTPEGQLLLGVMHREGRAPTGALHLFDGARFSTQVQEMTISNGIDWSPDRRTCYFVESASGVLYRQGWAGRLAGARERLLCVDKAEGEPDGIAVDSEGGIWVCLWDGSSIWRVHPESGTCELRAELPVRRPTSLAIVPGARRAFVTSAAVGDSSPLAGGLFEIELPGTAVGLSPRFAPAFSS